MIPLCMVGWGGGEGGPAVKLGNVKPAFQVMSLLVSWRLLRTELNGVWEDHGCWVRGICAVT